jgi:hypothetical protein
MKLNFGKRTSSLVCAVILNVGRAFAEAVSRWPPVAEVRIESRPNSTGVCSGKRALGLVYVRVFKFSRLIT